MKLRCLTRNNRQTRTAFLNLPKRLYQDEKRLNTYEIENELLKKKHPISQDVEIFPFVVVDNENNPICRCMMTYYPEDPVAYVGFFEAENNLDAVKKMFAYVERRATLDKKHKIIGPIDVSIYINARFKTDNFDSVYTGEPYNKDYYPTLWESVGFQICEKCKSYMVDPDSLNKCDNTNSVYQRCIEAGYEFISASALDFESCLEDIHELATRAYDPGMGHKPLTQDQFVEMFYHLIDFTDHMIKLMYKDGKIKAFCLAIPNYGELTRGNVNTKRFFKVIKARTNVSEYVILAIVADEESPELKDALIECIVNELKVNNQSAIIALAQGNTFVNLFGEEFQRESNYVLMSKNIS